MQRGVIDFITLGCSKNLVDAERVMRQLEAAGWKCVHDAQEPKGEICVINTCGFIGDAKEESIIMILQMAERKKKGKLRKLIVMGCLSERYRAELEAELPEVDAYYGKFDFEGMVDNLGIPEYRRVAGLLSASSLPRPIMHTSRFRRVATGCVRTVLFR